MKGDKDGSLFNEGEDEHAWMKDGRNREIDLWWAKGDSVIHEQNKKYMAADEETGWFVVDKSRYGYTLVMPVMSVAVLFVRSLYLSF